MQNNNAKQKNLDLIRQAIISDGVCPELSAQATQLVFGEGSPGAKIVFIGEAPGKKEDQLGLPFMGASGKFLDEMLESIKLKRTDVYITNIVKYRPPDNRDPSVSEKQTFLPYLQAQIEVIQPKLVVTLGRHSMNCFLPDLQISEIHGQPQKSSQVVVDHSFTVLPLYHPAAALYNGKMRKVLLEDFARIPDILKEIN